MQCCRAMKAKLSGVAAFMECRKLEGQGLVCGFDNKKVDQ